METAAVRNERSSKDPIVFSSQRDGVVVETLDETHDQSQSHSKHKDDETEEELTPLKTNGSVPGMNGGSNNNLELKAMGTDCQNGHAKTILDEEEIEAKDRGNASKNPDKKTKAPSKKLTKFVQKKRQNLSRQKVTACMLKTFNRMKKRWGFLVYQFVLPALQVQFIDI